MATGSWYLVGLSASDPDVAASNKDDRDVLIFLTTMSASDPDVAASNKCEAS